jgi:hypothetical protein
MEAPRLSICRGSYQGASVGADLDVTGGATDGGALEVTGAPTMGTVRDWSGDSRFREFHQRRAVGGDLAGDRRTRRLGVRLGTGARLWEHTMARRVESRKLPTVRHGRRSDVTGDATVGGAIEVTVPTTWDSHTSGDAGGARRHHGGQWGAIFVTETRRLGCAWGVSVHDLGHGPDERRR